MAEDEKEIGIMHLTADLGEVAGRLGVPAPSLKRPN